MTFAFATLPQNYPGQPSIPLAVMKGKKTKTLNRNTAFTNIEKQIHNKSQIKKCRKYGKIEEYRAQYLIANSITANNNSQCSISPYFLIKKY